MRRPRLHCRPGSLVPWSICWDQVHDRLVQRLRHFVFSPIETTGEHDLVSRQLDAIEPAFDFAFATHHERIGLDLDQLYEHAVPQEACLCVKPFG